MEALSIKSVEINLIDMPVMGESLQGSVTWMAKALKVEEAQVALSLDVCRTDSRVTKAQRLDISRRQDRLQSQINGLVQTMATFLGANWNSKQIDIQERDDNSDDADAFIDISPGDAEHMVLPFPSYIGLLWCSDLGLNGFVEHELQLRKGQANDVLHEIQLALADKAVLFHTEVRHGRNYTMTSCAWRKVADLDTVVKRYATVYQQCQRQMIALGVDSSILNQYKPLNQNDLTVSTMVADPMQEDTVMTLCHSSG